MKLGCCDKSLNTFAKRDLRSVRGLVLERIVYFHLFLVAGGDASPLGVVQGLGLVLLHAVVIALQSQVVEESHLSLLVHESRGVSSGIHVLIN